MSKLRGEYLYNESYKTLMKEIKKGTQNTKVHSLDSVLLWLLTKLSARGDLESPVRWALAMPVGKYFKC